MLVHSIYLLLFEIGCLFHFRNSAAVSDFAMLCVTSLFRDVLLLAKAACVQMYAWHHPSFLTLHTSTRPG